MRGETRDSKGAARVCSVERGRWANVACGGDDASASLLGVGGWGRGATFDGYRQTRHSESKAVAKPDAIDARGSGPFAPMYVRYWRRWSGD